MNCSNSTQQCIQRPHFQRLFRCLMRHPFCFCQVHFYRMALTYESSINKYLTPPILMINSFLSLILIQKSTWSFVSTPLGPCFGLNLFGTNSANFDFSFPSNEKRRCRKYEVLAVLCSISSGISLCFVVLGFGKSEILEFGVTKLGSTICWLNWGWIDRLMFVSKMFNLLELIGPSCRFFWQQLLLKG